jgi:hypothetical protein
MQYSQVMPIDLVNALCGGQRTVKTVAGVFTLAGVQDVRRITVVIASGPGENLRGNSCYCTLGMCPLLSWPRDLKLYGVLVWLPALNRYGYYDEDDTQDLVLFPNGLQWNDIEANLPYYLSAQARVSGVFPDVWDEVQVKFFFEHIPARLQDSADVIVALQGKEREKAAEKFIMTYEKPLTAYPLSADLLESYTALITVYSVLAEIRMQRHDAPGKVVALEVISWYERCALLIGRFKEADLPVKNLFASILLRLCFWYSDVGDFIQAERYAKRWIEYDPSARPSYPELHALLKLKEAFGAGYFQGQTGDFETS